MKLQDYGIGPGVSSLSLLSYNYACMFSAFSDRNLGVDSNLIAHFIYQKAQYIYFPSDYIFSKCFPFTKIILPICLILFSKQRIIPSKHCSHYLNFLLLPKITKFWSESSLKNLGSFFPRCPLLLLVWIYQMKVIPSLSAVPLLSTHFFRILMLSVEAVWSTNGTNL